MNTPNTTAPSRIDFSSLNPKQIEDVVDIGLRHRTGMKPKDYLKHWLFIGRHFGFATHDDSWGEFEKEFAIIIKRLVMAERPASPQQVPVRSAETDNDGVLTDGRNIHLGNGWNFRVKECAGDYRVQLVDRNGSPLLEGWMSDPDVAAQEFVEAQPLATPSAGVEIAPEVLKQAQQLINELDNPLREAKIRNGLENLTATKFAREIVRLAASLRPKADSAA